MKFLKVIWFAYKEKRKAYLLSRLEELEKDLRWQLRELNVRVKPTDFGYYAKSHIKYLYGTMRVGRKIQKKIEKIKKLLNI
jgi:hypothetical protein